ncbi:hypothetical protein DVH24_019343 [Malus domestica]|uniref:RNase H type-1 domain-containing protein n=1 Tax=Malus domestica TaxID=3750 RepID=A0A498I336_MALDO|nr:hypothetical protein DVH24_019343 [Malus domestica]
MITHYLRVGNPVCLEGIFVLFCPKVHVSHRWLKVNFDRAFDEQHDQGGIGVVVRDSNGSFVAAVSLNVELEGDVLLVVAVVQRDSTTNMGQLGHVLDDIRRLMKNFSQGEGFVYQSQGQQCCTLLCKI